MTDQDEIKGSVEKIKFISIKKIIRLENECNHTK